MCYHKVEFTLELYIEEESDREFAEKEAEKLRLLLNKLAPHIKLNIEILFANVILHSNDLQKNMPYVEPTNTGRQSLLITHEELTDSKRPGYLAQGRAGERCGCINEEQMEKKIEDGGNSADITIHEWLHTIYGQEINGRKIPFVDVAPPEFQKPGKGPDGEKVWHDWYSYILRWD